MTILRWLLLMVALLAGAAFPPAAAGAQQSLILPKGTTAQKQGPGQVVFSLPNGQKVEVKNYDAKSGSFGSCVVYLPGGRRLATGRGGTLGGGAVKIDDEVTWRTAPAGDYVKIDDEVTWLPATLKFELAGLIDPDPPYRPGQAFGNPDPPPRGVIDPEPPLHPGQPILDPQPPGRGLSPQPDPPGMGVQQPGMGQQPKMDVQPNLPK
jgi:hypothetical protein